jgi:hypothetical protein
MENLYALALALAVVAATSASAQQSNLSGVWTTPRASGQPRRSM